MRRSSRLFATVGPATAAVAVMLVTGAVAAKPAAPVINEKFTPLPCTGEPSDRTLDQLLACAERQVLRTDKQVDSISATVFSRVPGDAARRRFVVAARAWLGYRNADCASQADVFLGGTESALRAAQCMVARNRTRAEDLSTFASELLH
jgi:uncharacterized protein YecT (DUF1311 family)